MFEKTTIFDETIKNLVENENVQKCDNTSPAVEMVDEIWESMLMVVEVTSNMRTLMLTTMDTVVETVEEEKKVLRIQKATRKRDSWTLRRAAMEMVMEMVDAITSKVEEYSTGGSKIITKRKVAQVDTITMVGYNASLDEPETKRIRLNKDDADDVINGDDGMDVETTDGMVDVETNGVSNDDVDEMIMVPNGMGDGGDDDAKTDDDTKEVLKDVVNGTETKDDVVDNMEVDTTLVDVWMGGQNPEPRQNKPINAMDVVMRSGGGNVTRRKVKALRKVNGLSLSRGGPRPHKGTIHQYTIKQSSLKDVCNVNGKRCLDTTDEEHGGMNDTYGGMVDYDGTDMVEIESKFGMKLANPTARWGPKSQTGTSQVIRSKKRKTKFGLNGIIGNDVMKITNYFHMEGTNSQGR